MPRAWFFNIPFHGHINPTLPLIRELVRRGDEITYFSTRPYEEVIKATGAHFRGYDHVHSFEGSRHVSHIIHHGSLVAEATYALLPEVLSSVEHEQPDYLIYDMSAPWGEIASRKFNIPAVASFPHLPFYWRTVFNDWRVFSKVLASIRPGYGYWRKLQRQTAKIVKVYKLRDPKEINVLSSSAELNIVFSSRYFQPYDRHFDESYLYVGPDIDLERNEEPIVITKQNDQKLVYIAVGTVYQASLGFFQLCMQVFNELSYSVIMSIGRSVDPASLGSIPGNFTVAQFVPQLQVLQEADIFITHGGMNSISESVFLIVPMIVVPNTVEQATNAARVEQLQGGLYLDHKGLNADKLKQAVKRILSDPAFSAGLERIRTSFVEAGGIQRAADAIHTFKHTNNLSA
jgi:MGT family glycosyltransferase